jgi:hypothetical protein
MHGAEMKNNCIRALVCFLVFFAINANSEEPEAKVASVQFLELDSLPINTTPIKLVNKINVVANLSSKRFESYTLITSLEFLIAPTPLPDYLHEKNLLQEVSFAYLSNLNSINTQIIHLSYDRKVVWEKTTTVDLDEAVEKINDTNLWPYAMKATVYLVDRYGQKVSSESAILYIKSTRKTEKLK